MAKTVVVKQVGNPIRRPQEQRATLVGLGLHQLHKPRAVQDRTGKTGCLPGL